MKLHPSNLFVYPRVSLIERRDGLTRLRLDGLVCDAVCAARARSALAALPGVRDARVDFEAGVAEISGAAPDVVACQRAIDGVVVGKPLRRAADRARRLLAGAPRRDRARA